MSTVLLILGCPVYDKLPTPGPGPTPAPGPRPAPIDSLKEWSAPEVAQFFSDWATVLRRSQNVIRSNEDFRAAYTLSAELAFDGTLRGKYPGLGDEIDRILVEQMPDRFDTEKVSELLMRIAESVK